ncbi:hypothetical protein A9Q87_02070 [Flavobacteriales bacterium 34_180_T64]|nr:hypothetical protein A9Q87_02070 [Flavobacteriales bacterium 34_180_T64]
MLKKYLLICLIFPMLGLAQDKFNQLDKSSMETSILYDRAYKVANITDETKQIDALYFMQAYSELSKADYASNFNNITAFKEASQLGFINNYVPIGILHSVFDIINPKAFQSGDLTLDTNQNVIRTTDSNISTFKTFERTIASPLTARVKGLTQAFKILPELIANSTNQVINLIEIDFNDTIGFRTVTYDQAITINFNTEGHKKIDFKITLGDGTVKLNSAYIFIQLSSADYNARLALDPGDESPIIPINSTLTYQGFGEGTALLGTGEYKIYYDNVDGILDKPIFFVDGFDPNDTRTIPLMYSLMNFDDNGTPSNLADDIRDLGYDLVVLNFPNYIADPGGANIPISGGADFIQRNAYILEELITTINGLKTGSEQNVIIGPSMGGLISRYALRHMEQNSIDHDTRLYISFDSPHLGANVPIGIQYMFNYMVNGDPEIVSAAPLVDGLLNSAAAKQMLIDHYLSHLQGGSLFLQDPTMTFPLGAPNFRDAFQNELDAMGFPQNTRNVSMINGSGVEDVMGSGEAHQSGTPGMNLIDHIFDTGVVKGFNTRAIIKTYFTPRNVETITVTDFVGEAFVGIWVEAFSFLATAESISTTMNSGTDSAPGGQFDLYSFDDGTNPIITEFVANLNQRYFDFIPSLSALSITSETNWYAVADANLSPFANTHVPIDNEQHVTLTDANVAFALDEILNPPLSNVTFQEHVFKIEKNPISNGLTIISGNTYENATISFIDITGKVVYSVIQTLSERTSLPINLASGLYVLNIETSENFNYKSKIIVD